MRILILIIGTLAFLLGVGVLIGVLPPPTSKLAIGLAYMSVGMGLIGTGIDEVI